MPLAYKHYIKLKGNSNIGRQRKSSKINTQLTLSTEPSATSVDRSAILTVVQTYPEPASKDLEKVSKTVATKVATKI